MKWKDTFSAVRRKIHQKLFYTPALFSLVRYHKIDRILKVIVDKHLSSSGSKKKLWKKKPKKFAIQQEYLKAFSNILKKIYVT